MKCDVMQVNRFNKKKYPKISTAVHFVCRVPDTEFHLKLAAEA